MKKIIILLLFALMILYFLIDPIDALAASKEGIALWFEQIVPPLLPFAIISSLLISSHLFERIQRTKFGQRNRRISAAEVFVILCGFLFGFPIGSKLSADMCEKGIISKKRAQILCCFTNNLSPLFISGFVFGSQNNQPQLVLPTYMIVYVPAFIIGMGMLFHTKPTEVSPHKKTASRFQLDMQIIDTGIISGFETLIKLCGYIVFFSIGVHMLDQITFLPDTVRILLVGFTEITNGIATLAQSAVTPAAYYVLSVLFLSFGGLCGLAQTGSMIKAAKLSLKDYLKLKLILVGISTMLALFYQLLF